MQKYAVIDLGTNTFHLLIVDEQLTEIHRESIFVKLAEQGIETIGAAPFERALTTMRHFKNILETHQISKLKAFGTAALRTASNAKLLVQQIEKTSGIKVDIISGSQEARLIYQGVREVVPFGKNKGLIMDIGGGSVEFIIANEAGVLWAESFPIGVAVLYRNFHKDDPISNENIDTLKTFLNDILSPLHQRLKEHPVDNIIGASGTFDVLEAILVAPSNNVLTSSFPSEKFNPLYEQLLKSSLEERLQMENVPNSRAEMFIVALILIRYIIDLTKVPTINVSAYAMKEGILQEWLHEND